MIQTRMWKGRDCGRGSISDATIRLNMEKRRFIAAQNYILSLFLPIAFFLNLVAAGSCYAQMGVATGNGVAAPAKPLPPGMKPPVVRFEDIATQTVLVGLNVSGDAAKKQYIVET